MFQIQKIEQRDLPRTDERQTDEIEFEVMIRFSTKDLQWGWATGLAGVVRAAINGIAPTRYIA